MRDQQSNFERLERAVQFVANIVTAVCFVFMLVLAVYIVTDSDGPRGAFLYYHNHFTNFVDPVVRASVTETADGDFLYSYSVLNGSWGFQDIREVGLVTGPGRTRPARSDWEHLTTNIGFGRTVMRWQVTSNPDGPSAISRGNRRDGFVLRSSVLPAIVEAHAGHDLHYEPWTGLVSNETTPAGGRIVRWTVGPRKRPTPAATYTLLGELVPSVHQAAELGWITVELAEAFGRALGAAATAAKAGKKSEAVARLERLMEIVGANAGVQINEEAYALLAYNVEYVLKELAS